MRKKLDSSFCAIAVLMASAAPAGADTTTYSWDGSSDVLPDIYIGGDTGYPSIGGTYEMAGGRLHVSSPGGGVWIGNQFGWDTLLPDSQSVAGSVTFRVNEFTNDLDGTHGGCGRVRLFWFNAVYENGLNAFVGLYGSDKWMTQSAGWGPGGHGEWNRWEFNPDTAGDFAPEGQVYVYNSFNMKDPASDADFYRAIDMGTDHVLSWSAEYLAGCDVVRVTTALDGVPWTTTDVNRTFSNLGWTENALAKQHRSMEGPWDAEYTHIEWAPGDVTAPDCNSNDIPDSCDITAGTSQDEDSNGIPDECEVEGGLQRPGDGNQDGKLDLSDAIWLLGHLFLGTQPKLPCEGGTASSPGAGDRAVADVNGDGKIDLSDPVSILSFLFLGSKPPALGTECVRIAGCPEKCQ